jgi:hypothetical protein
VNGPPVAGAEGPNNGKRDPTVTLDGMGSCDPDGSVVASPCHAYATLVHSGANPVGDLDLEHYSVGEHLVVLTMTDDLGATEVDTTTLSVGRPRGSTIQRARQLHARV